MLYQIYQDRLSTASVVLFDYDSTIARVPVDWPQARVDFRSYLAEHFPALSLPESARVDEMEALALQYAPNQKARVFQYRLELESALDGGHVGLPSTCKLIRKLHVGAGHRLFIVSNNLRRTVEAGLEQLGLSAAFEAVLGVDDVGLPKPAPRAFQRLQASHGIIAKDCVLVGDNARTDGGFCRAVGIPFINIAKN